MGRPELNQTLTALVGAVPLDSPTTVVEVELDVPMEVSLSQRGAELVVHAAPGHTRFVSGVLPLVHRTRLHIVAGEDLPTVRPGDWSGPPPHGWTT